MADKTHDLEFAVLAADEPVADNNQRQCETYLEAFILENLLDRNLLFFLGHVEKASGEDDAKGAIAYDLAIGILNLLCLTRLSIASDDLYYFIWVVWVAGGARYTRGPMGNMRGVEVVREQQSTLESERGLTREADAIDRRGHLWTTKLS
jgi:hypothetical protein